MFAATLDLGARPIAGSRPRIARRETNFGVVFTETVKNARMEAFTEGVLRCLGLLVMLGGTVLSLGQVVVGSSEFEKFGMTLAFIFVGFSVYRYATSGMRSEIRVDSRFGFIRIGTVDCRNDFTEKRAFRKDQLETFFILRSKTSDAKLCLRVKNKPNQFILLEGSENDLVPVLERLYEVFFPPKNPRQRVQTRVEGDLIQARFV
jgi:hypothetical protein